MNSIILSPSFKRSYKKFLKKHPDLKQDINSSIKKLENDVFDRTLKTHKLSGKLVEYYGCSCGFDCRIVFSIQKKEFQNEFDIILISIGTHEEIY